MKITSKQFAFNIKNEKTDKFKLNLIYGDDLGLVKQFATQLSQKLADGNEMALKRISARDIVEEQNLLFDELLAVGMFSSIKVILIDDFIDLGQKQRKLNDILSQTLDMQDQLQDTFLIIPALGLEASSGLVKKFEKDQNANSVRCFVDSNFDIKKVVLEFFADKNKSVDTKALIFLQNSLGNDRLITMSELEKLDIYTQNSTQISLQDALDCVVSADSVNLFKFCDAICLKDKNQAQKLLFLLEEEGVDITVLLTGLIRHLKRLLIVKSNVKNNNTPISAEMNRLRPPVFFGKDDFEQQVKNFKLSELEQAVFNFTQLQTDTRLNQANAKTMIEQFVFNL